MDSKARAIVALANQAPHMSIKAPARALSFPTTNRAQYSAAKLPPPRALSFSTPNRAEQGAAKCRPQRSQTFSILEPSPRMSYTTPPLRAFSFSTSSQHPYGPLELPPLSASPIQMTDLSPPTSPETPRPLVRASSFPLPNRNWHEPRELRPRASPIPMPEQWRRSLKSSRSGLSSPALSDASTTASSRSATSSFHDILNLDLLPQLLPYLDNVPILHLIQNAAAWSYPRTLEQLLDPDRFPLKGDGVMRRSYLPPSVRSYIYVLAYTVSEGSLQGQATILAIFLTRFIMHHGTHVLVDAPRQCEDPIGPRELESRYAMAGEILGFLERNE